jgi:hypothetical protein
MVAWPEGQAGNGGVKFGPMRLLAGDPSGVQFGSPMVCGLPSPRPVRLLPGLAYSFASTLNEALV